MNPGITSKETILQVCRKIAAEQGIAALSMRTVAKACGIALGTLYNYYSDKDELLLATVESIWKDIFHADGSCKKSFAFPEYVDDLFDCVQKGAAAYPNFLTAHSIAIAQSKKGEARSTMERYFDHMKAGMLAALRADPAVNPAAFSTVFTPSDLVDFVLDHILLLLVKEAESCTALVELVRRVIYR